MNHIKTDDCNMVYRGPEPGIGDLHCRRSVIDGRGRTAIFSVWTFTDEERKAIAEGANVELAIYHYEPIPPVSMLVTTKGADACAPKILEQPRIAANGDNCPSSPGCGCLSQVGPGICRRAGEVSEVARP